MAAANGHIRLRLTALTGEVPLTPLDAASLLTPAARPDRDARRKLAFLSYREKSLAGSWRFNTYFGRDTLMSLRLLQPVLRPSASEAGLASVLARLSPEGEAAHEEGIGEFALLARQGQSDAPTFPKALLFVLLFQPRNIRAILCRLNGCQESRGKLSDHTSSQILSGHIDVFRRRIADRRMLRPCERYGKFRTILY